MTFFVFSSGRNSRSMWVGGRIRSVAKRVTALHCNLFSRIKYYAYTKYIVLIREQFQTTSTTFKIKCKKWYLVTVIYEMSLFK